MKESKILNLKKKMYYSFNYVFFLIKINNIKNI